MFEWRDGKWGSTVPAPKLRKGDRVAILSPTFAAPGFAAAVHEQAVTRFAAATGLVPVEYPTTRQLRATAKDRAADLNAAFRDPTIRAILATIGGDDQITVIPHLDAGLARADPKIFLGYSDNTNLLKNGGQIDAEFLASVGESRVILHAAVAILQPATPLP